MTRCEVVNGWEHVVDRTGSLHSRIKLDSFIGIGSCVYTVTYSIVYM
jgi:hypothetical protein